MPSANTHAVVVPDPAGGHTTGAPRLPETLSVLPLPATSPELNPVGTVCPFPRQTRLSNRLFDGYGAIVIAACAAGNSRIANPAQRTSIGPRQWAITAHK